MKDLLNYLKSSIEKDWLYCYDRDRGYIRADNKNYSSILYRHTEQKLEQILDLTGRNSRRLAVFIVDRDFDFISSFLAGVIAEVDLFICDPTWQQQEWQQVLNIVKPDVIFGDESVKSLVTQLTTPTVSARVNVEHPLIMMPTGGTSGKIKFAIHSWSTLTASVAGFKEFFDCQTINSWCTLPLYHVSGLMQLMRSLLTGGNLVICPYKLISQVQQDRATYFISLVPTQLQFLLNTNPHWLKGFKTVLVGGAPARRSLLDTARDNQIAVSLIYGSTETASGVVALKPEDFLTGNTSSGKVLPHARISIDRTLIIDAELRDSERAGLITIVSKSLCLGYYPQLFPSNSLTTDDLGYIDLKGYLHILGRNSHKIITGGKNVFPTEVEAIIYATKLVKDVCVLGIPDRYWGQAVTAVYSLKANDNLNLIKQQIQLQLAKYKQPKNWIEVDRLPRNDRGKINYQQLKAIAIQKLREERSNYI